MYTRKFLSAQSKNTVLKKTLQVSKSVKATRTFFCYNTMATIEPLLLPRILMGVRCRVGVHRSQICIYIYVHKENLIYFLLSLKFIWEGIMLPLPLLLHILLPLSFFFTVLKRASFCLSLDGGILYSPAVL